MSENTHEQNLTHSEVFAALSGEGRPYAHRALYINLHPDEWVDYHAEARAILARHKRENSHMSENTLDDRAARAAELHALLDRHGPATPAEDRTWQGALSRVAWLCGRHGALQGTAERVRAALGSEGQ